eukprot:COSAG02_NODE_1579_length_11851_cov_12.490343_7_plen_45_part_00
MLRPPSPSAAPFTRSEITWEIDRKRVSRKGENSTVSLKITVNDT